VNLSKEIEGMYFAECEDDLCNNCMYSKITKVSTPTCPSEWSCANKKHQEAIQELEFQLTNGKYLRLYTCPGFEEA